MAAPKNAQAGKAFYVEAQDIVNKLVADGTVETSTTIADALTAIAAEIAAR